MPGKATRAEIISRIEQVVELRLGGAEQAQVVEYGNAREWSVGPRMIRKYIAAADKKIGKQAEQNRSRNIGLHIGRRMNVLRRAMANDDLKTALAVLKDLAALQALYPEQAVKLQFVDQTPRRNILSKAEQEELRVMCLKRLAIDLDSPSGPVDAGVKGDTNGHTVEPPAEGVTGAGPAPTSAGPAPPPEKDPEVYQDQPRAPHGARELYCNTSPEPLWKQPTPRRMRRALGGDPPPGSEYWRCPQCQGRFVVECGVELRCPDCCD
jgi:hypothetical protein